MELATLLMRMAEPILSRHNYSAVKRGRGGLKVEHRSLAIGRYSQATVGQLSISTPFRPIFHIA